MISKWSPQEGHLFLSPSASEGKTLDFEAPTAAEHKDAGETTSPVVKEEERDYARELIGSSKDNDTSSSQIFNLQELITLYGKSSIPELLLSFIEEGTAILSAAKKAIEEKDVEALKMQAHTFKGMAAVLTAANLARLSLKIEDAAKKADFESADQHFNELSSAFCTAETAIKKFLEEK
jgi:HPt (histidine-containing phosphotransfer) domain-containing protein